MPFTQPKAAPTEGFDLFNLDCNVGYRAFNIKPDVMLVQAMLNLFYFDLKGDGGPNLGTFTIQTDSDGLDDGAPLPIDGFVTEKLRLRIVNYQADLAFKSPAGVSAYHTDSVFDPYRPDLSRSTRTHSLYTFYQINLSCMRAAARAGDLSLYYGLRDLKEKKAGDVPIPAQLRNALKTSKTTADQYRKAAAYVSPFNP